MRTRAIILKKQNVGEYDQLVMCYSEELGKLTAVAKSILKSSSIQSMHLDMFNLVDFDLINGRSTPIITGAQAEKTYLGFKSDLSSLATAYFFAETASRLFFDYQKDEQLWEFFTTLLAELESKPKNAVEFLKTKQIEFLDILGYAPNLRECAFCSAPTGQNVTAYSVEARGAICKDCFFNGNRGIVIKNNELFTGPVIGAIFESLIEHKLHSLNLIKSVIQ